MTASALLAWPSEGLLWAAMQSFALRPISAIRGPELGAPKLPVGPAHRHMFAGPPPRAHIGRRHKGRLRRGELLETLRAHHFGSPSCKPSAGSPSGRRLAPRSTTSPTARSRPRCTASCISTPLPSSPSQRWPPGPTCRSFVKDEFDAFLECDIPCPRLAAPALRRLRPRQAGRLQLQAARLLPLVRRQAHGAGGGAPGRQRHPHVPVRQWVLSLPIPLRLRLAAKPKLVTPVQQVVNARPLAPAPLALAPVRPSS